MSRFVTPPSTWQEGLISRKIVHLRETCDSQPRRYEHGDAVVGVAVCGAWVPDRPDSRHDLGDRTPCVVCAAVARQLGRRAVGSK